MAKVAFDGEPYAVDVILRPFLSGTRWAIGGLFAALFIWLEWWWWVPVPLVVATLAVETYLTLRSDRPVHITITNDKVVVDDRFAATLTVYAESIHAVTVLTRQRSQGLQPGYESVIVLSSDRRVLLAIAVQAHTPSPLAIDVDDLDRFLGAQAGLLRAVAPPTRTCRQRVPTLALIDALVALAPPQSRTRTAIRLWHGSAPELSPFGLHDDEPDSLLLLHADQYEHRDAAGELISEGELRVEGWRVQLREAVLLRVAGEDEAQAGQLPLLVIQLPTLTVAIPAPLRHSEANQEATEPALHHTHAPEGAALLHALRRLDRLPTSLRPAPPMQASPSGDTVPAGDPSR